MPGVKNNGVQQVEEISLKEYLEGKRQEVENIFLKKLREYNFQTA
jgi:hypothetical protein